MQAREILTGAVTTAFSADGSRLAAVSDRGTIGLWDLEDGQQLWSLQLWELPSISKESTATAEDRKAPVAAPELRAPTAGPKPEDATMGVGQLALDEGGSVLAAVVKSRRAGQVDSQQAPTPESRIRAWDVDAAKDLPEVTLAEQIQDLVLSPGGNRVAAVTESGDVLVWDPHKREDPLRLATGDWVDALVFSPDGARLATATRLETRIWDVSNREGKSVTLPSVGGVEGLAFSPDGRHLVAAASDGRLELYPLDVQVLLEEACTMVTRNLTQVEWETNERAVEFPQICPQQPLHDTVILALVREGKIQEARAYVARAGRSALAAGYELGITSDDAVARAHFAWAEQLAAEGDYDEAVVKLDLARQEIADLGPEARAEAAKATFAVCRQVTELGPTDLVSPACAGIATLAREIGMAETVTGTVDSEPGDVWAFAGEEGQWLTVAMDQDGPGIDAYLNLYAPDGQLLISDDDGGGDRNALIAGFHLPEDGIYLVNADGLGDGRGAYTLSLREVMHRAITLGVPAEGQIENGVFWTFEGEAGQTVRIAMAGKSDLSGPVITVRGPDGTLLDTASNDEGRNALFPSLELPADGTYTVLPYAATSSGGYTLSVTERVPQPIRLGVPVEDRLENGVFWTFAGEAGQIVRIAMEGKSDLSGPLIEVRGPGETFLDSDGNPEGRNLVFPRLVLPADGTYTVVPDASVSSGGYTLSVTELVPQPIELGQPVEGDIQAGTVWAFQGEAGQLVRIAMEGRGDLGGLSIEWRDPLGTLIGWAGASEEDRNVQIPYLALPRDGRYVLTLDSEQSGAYTLTVTVPATQTLRLGEPETSDTAEGPVWTFEGLKGQVVRIDLRAGSSDFDPYLELLAPDGIRLAYDDDSGGDRGGGHDSRIVAALPQDGVYLVLPRGSSRQMGPYELTVQVESAEASEATRLLAESLLAWAQAQVEGGRIEAAIALYEEADAVGDVSADEWNQLCWDQSIEGFAAQVLPACERAVALAPDDAGHRDSRGLARALTGDIQGAIEDFRFFVEQWDDEELVAQRQAWIAALEAGENPFDAATLQALRNQ